MTSMFFAASPSPMRMIAPSPKSLRIWAIAASSALPSPPVVASAFFAISMPSSFQIR